MKFLFLPSNEPKIYDIFINLLLDTLLKGMATAIFTDKYDMFDQKLRTNCGAWDGWIKILKTDYGLNYNFLGFDRGDF